MRCEIALGKPTLRNGCIGVNAAVAEKGPVAANFVHLFRVALGDKHVFFTGGRLCDDAAERIGHEGVAPKFKATFGSAFEARAIDGRDIDAVGDGVRALDGAPSVELGFAVLRLL